MKHFISIFILSLLLVIKGVAQDTVNTTNKITYVYFHERYLYQSKYITENYVDSILFHTKNKQIIAYIDTANRAKYNPRIDYIYIPAAFATLGCLVAGNALALGEENTKDGKPTANQRLGAYALIGGGLFFGSITFAFPVMARKYYVRHRKYLTEAIRLYNQSH